MVNCPRLSFLTAVSWFRRRRGSCRRPNAELATAACDAPVRLETDTPALLRPTWMSYPGGDATDAGEVRGTAWYAQGHKQWLDNTQCVDRQDQGTEDRLGIGSTDPVTGKALPWNPRRPAAQDGQEVFATAAELDSHPERSGAVIRVRAYAPLAALLMSTALALTGPAAFASAPRCPGFLTQAHRGAHAYHGENTVPAFLAAAADGVWSETDVRISKDGRFVLMHDRTVDRTTNGTGEVANMTSNHLLALHVNGGGHVPSLKRALSAQAGTSAGLFLEMKPGPWWTDTTLAQLQGVVRRSGMLDRAVVTTFGDRYLAMLASSAPELLTEWKPLPGVPVTARAVKERSDEVGLLASQLRPRLVTNLHAAGVPVYGRLADTDAVWRRWSRLGLDGGLTDDPYRLQSWCSG